MEPGKEKKLHQPRNEVTPKEGKFAIPEPPCDPQERNLWPFLFDLDTFWRGHRAPPLHKLVGLFWGQHDFTQQTRWPPKKGTFTLGVATW